PGFFKRIFKKQDPALALERNFNINAEDFLLERQPVYTSRELIQTLSNKDPEFIQYFITRNKDALTVSQLELLTNEFGSILSTETLRAVDQSIYQRLKIKLQLSKEFYPEVILFLSET